MARWGLVPFWAKDTKIGNRLINARSETAGEKPAFRTAYKKKRCLLPASGWYEWKKAESGKQPYRIHSADNKPFCFAGLYETWGDDESEPLVTCTILTRDATEKMSSLHHRMPVILPEDCWSAWLLPAMNDRDALDDLVETASRLSGFDWYPVTRQINSPKYQQDKAVEPIDP